jgi:folate-binding protein YgfZ
MESRAMPGARPGQATGTLLRLEGKDALGLLHRISTQSLLELQPGQACATLFCDFRGRLLHRAWVAVTGDHAVWLLRDDAPTIPLADFLERFVFREEVRIGVPREDWSVRQVSGNIGLEPGAVRERDGIPHEIQTRPDWALVLVPPTAPPPLPELEHARILAGLPRHGHEIAESFSPFEVGLGHEIHLRKGCYTGQEALLRLVTYKSVRRRLARVSGPGAPPEIPREIRHGESVVGWITSVAAESDPQRGPGWTGLAVVQHQACDQKLELVHEGGAVAIVHAFEMLPPLGLS